MDKVYVLSHTSDIDGLGSAALLRIKYKVPLENIFFVAYTEDSLKTAEKRLSSRYKNGITLFMTDLGLSKDTEGHFKKILTNVKKNGGHVFWFDHHVWTDKSIKTVATKCDVAVVGENRHFCGMEITRLMLGLNDPFSRSFAEVVHCSDFNLKPKNSEMRKKVGTYALSIAYYNTLDNTKRLSSLRHMVDVLSKKRFSDSKIEADAKYFNDLNEKRIKVILNNLYLGDKVTVGFADEKVQATWACDKMMNKAKRKIAVLINTFNGTCHLRSKKEDKADLSLLANKFGGGGHPHAAGFSLDLKKYNNFKSEKEKQKFAESVDRMISRR